MQLELGDVLTKKADVKKLFVEVDLMGLAPAAGMKPLKTALVDKPAAKKPVAFKYSQTVPVGHGKAEEILLAALASVDKSHSPVKGRDRACEGYGAKCGKERRPLRDDSVPNLVKDEVRFRLDLRTRV